MAGADHQAGVKLGAEDLISGVERAKHQNDRQHFGPFLLGKQVDCTLAKPGCDQDGPEQIPQAINQRVPAEGAIIEFTKTTDTVEDRTKPPE